MNFNDKDSARAYNRAYYLEKKAQPKVAAIELKALLHYSQETGLFTYLIGRGRKLAGAIAGTITPDGRSCIVVKGRRYFTHRLVWLYVTGDWPTQEIDHIDGNTLNNRCNNLRDVPARINQQNRRKAPASKKYSALFGAHWCEQGRHWKSSIRVNGRAKHLGVFATEDDASAAYLKAKREFHEGCTI